MNSLGSLNFLDLLPGSISTDPTLQAAAGALNDALCSTSRSVPNLLLQARLWQQPASSMLPPLGNLASSVVTQEATLEDSMCNDTACSMESLSPSVSPSGNGCRTEARGGLKDLSLAELELLAWQMHVDFRDVATTREQLAEMVRQSIPWHRIKGTPASVRKALALFGYSATIEPNGPGRWWATYQLGLPDLVSLDDVRRIVSVCKEMAPARSRLWRVYAGFDRRPIVLTRGPALSNGWLTYYSGTHVPVGDDDVMVSFGSRRGLQSEQAYPGDQAASMQTSLHFGSLCPYVDRFILGRSRLTSDHYPRNHSFVVGQLVSLMWASPQTTSNAWGGPWTSQPWQTAFGWDRPLPTWRIDRLRRVARSQIVPSHPVDASGTGTLGDSNARLGRTFATTFDGWGQLSSMRLSQSVRRNEQELTHMTCQRHAFALAPVVEADSPRPCAMIYGHTALGTDHLYDQRWRGPWISRRWWPHAITTATPMED